MYVYKYIVGKFNGNVNYYGSNYSLIWENIFTPEAKNGKI